MTVPLTDTTLDSFTFYVDLPTNLIFRGEVYAWDPNTTDPNSSFALGSATGSALYASGQMHTTSYGNPPGTSPRPITFNIPGGLPLTAGAQYVLFLTTSVDFAANAGITAIGFVGYTGATDTYSGGDEVFVDDGGDPNQWTTKGGRTPPCSLDARLALIRTISRSRRLSRRRCRPARPSACKAAGRTSAPRSRTRGTASASSPAAARTRPAARRHRRAELL